MTVEIVSGLFSEAPFVFLLLLTVEIMSQYNQKDDTDKQIRFRHTINMTKCLTQKAKTKSSLKNQYIILSTMHIEDVQRGCWLLMPQKNFFFSTNDEAKVNIILFSFPFAHVCEPMSTWHT